MWILREPVSRQKQLGKMQSIYDEYDLINLGFVEDSFN